MKKLIFVAGALVLLMAANASAQLTSSAGYSHVSLGSADVGLVQGTVGVRYPVGLDGRLVLLPEGRVGLGVSSDTVGGVKVELNNFFGAVARLQLETDEGFYGFLYPSYSHFKVRASAAGVSVSESGWEFGAGAGVGFRVSDFLGVELSYERIDDADVINGSLRFGF